MLGPSEENMPAGQRLLYYLGMLYKMQTSAFDRGSSYIRSVGSHSWHVLSSSPSGGVESPLDSFIPISAIEANVHDSAMLFGS